MLTFKRITFEDKELLQSYYGMCRYESSEYSAGIKLFWSRFYSYEYAISTYGSLIIKCETSGDVVFDMPVFYGGFCQEKGWGQLQCLNADLDEIDEYCVKNEIAPIFSDVPEELLGFFAVRYNFTKIENYRGEADYIYRVEDLRDLKGRKNSGKRNHINKFKSLYPGYKYKELAPTENLAGFWSAYYGENADVSATHIREKDSNSESYIQEKAVAMELAAKHSLIKSFVSGAIEIDGRLAAFCIGEILGSMVIVHVEKALTEYKGIYQLLIFEFLKHLPSGIVFVNKEEDCSDKGLRISKLGYRPCKLLPKYVIRIKSEFMNIDAIPCIETERLTLDEITEADAAVYRAICMDDERNKYWDYDYRTDLPEIYAAAANEESIPLDYFVKVIQNDFARRSYISLAVRFDGQMIGEVVLEEADYKGGVEIGCRLLKEYECRGFGREAMTAISDWALYKAGFRRVKARCCRENIASFKMLSSFMKKISEDESFFYFETNC